MSNKLQIKRTTVSGRAPNTTNSANTTFIDTGELALNLADGKLFTSNGSNLIEFGTGTPVYDASGNLITMTYVQISTLSNAASHLVPATTNTYDIGTTSLQWRDVYISDNVSVGNTSVNTTISAAQLALGGNILANGSVGTSGQVLTSNGSGNVYWSTASGGGVTTGKTIAMAIVFGG